MHVHGVEGTDNLVQMTTARDHGSGHSRVGHGTHQAQSLLRGSARGFETTNLKSNMDRVLTVTTTSIIVLSVGFISLALLAL
jgi:hypothetical protein